MESALLEHCNRTMTVYPFDKIVDGDASYKDPIQLMVYYEPEVQMIRDMLGREVVSQGIIFINGTDHDKLSVKDKIHLDYMGDVVLLKLDAFQELYGPGWDHLEVYV